MSTERSNVVKLSPEKWPENQMRPEEAASYVPPEDQGTFNGTVEEFHEWCATHGHPPGNPTLRPGSIDARLAVGQSFGVSDEFNDRTKAKREKAIRTSKKATNRPVRKLHARRAKD